MTPVHIFVDLVHVRFSDSCHMFSLGWNREEREHQDSRVLDSNF